MKQIILKRIAETLAATFGAMIYNHIPFCVTVELPWKDNREDISRIPAGTYKLKKRLSSPSFKYPHWDILDVPGRTDCKVHKANWASQLKGCIAVAEAYEILADRPLEPGIADSAGALAELNEIAAEDQELELVVKDIC